MNEEKKLVHDFWEKATCGEKLYLSGKDKNSYLDHSKLRYTLEPFILKFAKFEKYRKKRVLEIGVGLGADHQKFAEAGAILNGIDLTHRAINFTRKRFEIFGLESDLMVHDSESLPFEDGSFDLVYSWGVLHHTPDTQKAINECYRVLKKGGVAKVMIYNKYSMVGYMLWLRYALLKMKPGMSLEQIFSQYMESPGTKAYSIKEARNLFWEFSQTDIWTVLSHGDLLSSQAGQRHRGLVLSLARRIWPRWMIKEFFSQHGLFMMIRANK